MAVDSDGFGRSRRRFTYFGLVPFVLFGGAFIAYPMISLFVGAFLDDAGSLTLSNFRRLASAATINAYWTSILLSAVTALLGGALGFLLAVAAFSRGMPQWVRTSLATFSAVTTNFAGVPLAFAFIVTLGNTGLVTLIMRDTFGVDIATGGFSLYSFWGLALVYLYFQVPLMVLVIGPALDGLRDEWRDAAASLGATPGTYWTRVALPVLRPSLLGGTVLLFANAFGAHATAYTLTSGQIPLVPMMIGQVKTGDVLSDPRYGDAMAAGMILILAASMLVYSALMRKANRWRD